MDGLHDGMLNVRVLQFLELANYLIRNESCNYG